MKKHWMLVSTAAVVAVTFLVYLYQNIGLPKSKYKYPEIGFESKKFGKIREFLWSPADEDNLIFLSTSSDGKSGREEAWLYYVNVNTGNVKPLYQLMPIRG